MTFKWNFGKLRISATLCEMLPPTKYFWEEPNQKGPMKKPRNQGTVAEGIATLIALPLVMLFMISYLYGFEPQCVTCCSMARGHAQNFSFSEYMRASTTVNGDGWGAKAITTIAYPGAKAGRLVHNLTVH